MKETLRYREALFADVENACNVTRPTATKRLEELVAAGVLDDRRAGRDRLFVNVPLMEILRNPKAATSARWECRISRLKLLIAARDMAKQVQHCYGKIDAPDPAKIDTAADASRVGGAIRAEPGNK